MSEQERDLLFRSASLLVSRMKDGSASSPERALAVDLGLWAVEFLATSRTPAQAAAPAPVVDYRPEVTAYRPPVPGQPDPSMPYPLVPAPVSLNGRAGRRPGNALLDRDVAARDGMVRAGGGWVEFDFTGVERDKSRYWSVKKVNADGAAFRPVGQFEAVRIDSRVFGRYVGKPTPTVRNTRPAPNRRSMPRAAPVESVPLRTGVPREVPGSVFDTAVARLVRERPGVWFDVEVSGRSESGLGWTASKARDGIKEFSGPGSFDAMRRDGHLYVKFTEASS